MSVYSYITEVYEKEYTLIYTKSLFFHDNDSVHYSIKDELLNKTENLGHCCGCKAQHDRSLTSTCLFANSLQYNNYTSINNLSYQTYIPS